MWENHWVSLSVRDYSHPEKYIGDPKDWDLCEKILQEISDEMGLEAKRCEGEAALYGPKLDFMFKDATGREVQIPTVQLDFATPKRFDLTYIDEAGKPAHPVMIHRAILGSYERFMALLIEHFAGAFPVWLAPVQVRVLPLSMDKHLDYAKKVVKELSDKNIRVQIDERNESMGKKIREAEMQKIPYMLVIGDREQEAGKVAVRKYGEGDKGQLSVEELIGQILT
jgi:threonyl-tRNA synthetase